MSRNCQAITAAVIGALSIATFTGGANSSAAEAAQRPLSCKSADVVGLAPLAVNTVALGAYTGVAYYTAEAAGYQVVATVAPGEGGAPIRFETTLADGQHAILSVPQAVGSPALEVEFQRCGDAVVVRAPTSAPPTLAVVE